MKISNAIAIIALVLQGLLLHTDARLGSLYLDDEDYPASPSYFRDDSEFDVEVNFNEEASDFVLESSGGTAEAEEAGSGVYLQASSGSGSGSGSSRSRHGKRCRPPFPNCPGNSQCLPRNGRHHICVDRNKCIPARVRTQIMARSRCCNGYRRIPGPYGRSYALCL